MTELWYNNMNVILEDCMEVFPNNNLNHNQKINAIFRMALILIIFILVFKVNQKYMAFPIVLIIVSLCLGHSETFVEIGNKKCYNPNLENPFMNFTLNDYYKNPDRKENCRLTPEIRKEQRELYKKRLVPDQNDLWGQNISDRNFYTMPSTSIVNDQTGFGNWLYGESGQCKSFGINCLKTNQSSTGVGMYHSVNH